MLTTWQPSLEMALRYSNLWETPDDKLSFENFLPRLLWGDKWTKGNVALLLRKGVDARAFVSDESYIHLALQGSHNETLAGIKDVLILLINSGANVSAKGNFRQRGEWLSPSDVACDAKSSLLSADLGIAMPIKKYRLQGIVMPIRNCGLQIKRLWEEALSECGYDVNEFPSTNAMAASESYCRCVCTEPCDMFPGDFHQHES